MFDSQISPDSGDGQAAISATATPAVNPADANSAPAGTEASPGGSPFKVSPDTLLEIDGKPVKFSDYTRNWQSKFTQASQEAARHRQAVADRERQIQQLQEAQRRQSQPQADPTAQMLEQLKSQPYLTGEEAVGLLQHMSNEVRQRDQVLIAALTKVKELSQVVNQLYGNHRETEFNSKIERWVKDLGYGPEANEVAKEIFLAYTGDDLESEFPTILANRMRQLEQMFEARKRSAAEAARRQPFIPGRGGSTGPSAPIKIKPNASAAEIADALWVNRGGAETT